MKSMLLFSIAEQVAYYQIHWKELLVIIFIGAVAGLLAEFLVGSKGFGMIVTIILGIIGAWLGNLLFGSFLKLTHNPLIDQIICATAGAIIIVVILSIIFRLKPKDRSDWKV